ncbi:class I SAM-dependent methyltransferase [Roseibium suaedae]|uniref:S-adenosyl-L-methionine methyltransferase n=1 Tax=Roseibium suaedae TaxID=735517 RepID=A0A1M7CH63_9HYPH|nr:class I SAM-dependent methyltransferase [Roseibium suaedae]SHL66189.1 S-adenosyl-L-methionine methyltransferase [Roseibium suaedae]
MSRLDSFIRRLTAQKILLEDVTARLKGVEGPVLELGLGNGRTYDHIREILPDREIYVFDRDLACHPSCIPDAEHMIFGEIRDTLAYCGPRIKAPAAFIHCDLGSGDPTMDLATSSWLSPLIDKHTAAGGYVLSGLPLELPNFETLPKPEGIRPGRYHLYRKQG